MKGYRIRTFTDEGYEGLTSFTSLMRRLLLARDITNEEDARRFLAPEWERDTHDPYTMKDMESAVERIMFAVEKKETIALWSDYDMDGIPGAVILYDFFIAIGYEHLVHYTPHRNKEGFGLNTQGIEELADQKVSLIITIDCGIVDVLPVAFAREKNIDVVITDHHTPPQTLPDAYAILNPKQKECSYREEMLCGAGVAFKLVQALLFHVAKNKRDNALHVPKEGWEKWLLDMVGMATVADMVPLRGENRVLAHYGLLVLRKSRRLGLQALLRKAKVDQKKLTEEDVAFTIAPRINAASRMGHARDAFKLLSARTQEEAGEYAEVLDQINKERKIVVATMKREISRRLEKSGTVDPVIVLGNPEWKPSLLGLVASSLADTYARPVFLWGREGGNGIKGSCRSYGSCNVYELMHSVRDRFIEFGGHAYSGGFVLEDVQVHTLGEALSQAYLRTVKEEDAHEKFYDEVFIPDDVSWNTYREIEKFAPFGQGNERPLFLFHNILVHGVRTFGKTGEHLELSFIKGDGGVVKAIRFFTGRDSFGFTIQEGMPLTFVAYLEVSNFLGRTELRLRIVDVERGV